MKEYRRRGEFKCSYVPISYYCCSFKGFYSSMEYVVESAYAFFFILQNVPTSSVK